MYWCTVKRLFGKFKTSTSAPEEAVAMYSTTTNQNYIWTAIFLIMTPTCMSLPNFRGTYCYQCQGNRFDRKTLMYTSHIKFDFSNSRSSWQIYVISTSEISIHFYSLHKATSKKTITFTFVGTRTWNLTVYKCPICIVHVTTKIIYNVFQAWLEEWAFIYLTKDWNYVPTVAPLVARVSFQPRPNARSSIQNHSQWKIKIKLIDSIFKEIWQSALSKNGH